MELLGKIALFIHILAGILTLITGPIAIFYNFKNTKRHRQVGKIFFWAMMVVCFSAVIGWAKHYNVDFYQFLLSIAIIVFAGILRGVRTIQIMKGGNVLRFDFLYTWLLGAFGLWMFGMAYYSHQNGSMIAIPILFGIFGLGALNDTKTNFRIFNQPDLVPKSEWLKLHISTMLGAFTASSTAFTVNAAHFLPWYIQWFGPTILLLPLQFYWGKKSKVVEIR
jgi:uncharacterized membrane protein